MYEEARSIYSSLRSIMTCIEYCSDKQFCTTKAHNISFPNCALDIDRALKERSSQVAINRPVGQIDSAATLLFFVVCAQLDARLALPSGCIRLAITEQSIRYLIDESAKRGLNIVVRLR